MNITRNIINDLLPLYAANECSPDTRALVEDYLRQHPSEAAELRRILVTALPAVATRTERPSEMEPLRKARRLLQARSWVMGLAIFFSLAPFSLIHTGGRTYWLLTESPKGAALYATIGVFSWITYFILRQRARVL